MKTGYGMNEDTFASPPGRRPVNLCRDVIDHMALAVLIPNICRLYRLPGPDKTARHKCGDRNTSDQTILCVKQLRCKRCDLQSDISNVELGDDHGFNGRAGSKRPNLDLSWRNLKYDLVREKVLTLKLDMVGFTATTPLMSQLRDLTVPIDNLDHLLHPAWELYGSKDYDKMSQLLSRRWPW
jgi:hypothetical protein